jgi:hypothetical protein
MNSYDRKCLDNTLDYQEVLPACYEFNTNYIHNWNLHQLEIILSHYFHLLSDSEMSVRMAANSGFEIYFSSNKTGFENKFLNLLIRNFKKFA